jgi:hypothetical protein
MSFAPGIEFHLFEIKINGEKGKWGSLFSEPPTKDEVLQVLRRERNQSAEQHNKDRFQNYIDALKLWSGDRANGKLIFAGQLIGAVVTEFNGPFRPKFYQKEE